MPAFDTLQPASFASIKFPVSEMDVSGGLRDHVHEYPHSPGGAPEKMGRKLYEATAVVPAHNTFKAWPTLFPKDVAALRQLYEAQVTSDLVIPFIGTIRAYITTWNERMVSTKRSGVEVRIGWREDQSNEFLVDSLIQAKAADVSVVAANIVAEVEDEEFSDLFDGIQDLANSITSIADQVQLQGDLLDAKLQGLDSNIRSIFATVPALGDPRNHPVAALLRGMAVAAAELREDMLKQQATIITFLTPRRMSVTEVSIAVYGNTAHAMEVMQMNPIDDPFSIPQGTALRVYSPALSAAA